MNKPQETPLTDLLQSVPKEHHLQWETQWAEDGTPTGYTMCPIGKLCHKAAERIKKLTEQVDALDSSWERAKQRWHTAEQQLEAVRSAISQFCITRPSADQMLIWQQNFKALGEK